MAVDVRIITQITGDAKTKAALNQIKGTVDQTETSAKSATTAFGGLTKAARLIGPALAATGIVAGIKAIITETSNARETTQKFDAVFKDLAETTRQWASDSADALNRSQIDLEAYLATLQDTFVPMGFARDQAAEMAKQLVVLGADLAAFNNEADADVINALTSAMVGNTEAVRRYGIDLSQAALDQELVNSGLADGVRNATRQEKAMASLNIILRSSSDAQGTAAKEAEGFAGQMRALEAATRDLMVALGESGLIQIATKVIGALADLAKASGNVINTMREFAGDPVKAAESLGDSIENFIIEKFIRWRENALVLTEAMSLLFEGEFSAAIDSLKDFNKEIEVAVEALEETADVAEDAADAVSDFTKETKRSENAIDDATRATIEHHRRLNEGLGILRRQKDAERDAAEAARQRARETSEASKNVVETMSDEARERCGFEKKIDECGNETWVKSRDRSKRLTKELIRNAEGVKIFACRVAKEQEVCVTENQIIIETEAKNSNERIKKSWEDMLGDITKSTQAWENEILAAIGVVLDSIIDQIGGGIDVGLHFNVSVSGAGGKRNEREIAGVIVNALGILFGGTGGLGGQAGGGQFGLPAGTFSTLGSAFGPVGTGIGAVIDIFGEDIVDIGGKLLGEVGDILGGVGDFVGDIFGGLFQRGGDFVATSPTFIGVGEAGAERVRITPLGAHQDGGSTIVLQGPNIFNEIGLRRFIRGIDRGLEHRQVRSVGHQQLRSRR